MISQTFSESDLQFTFGADWIVKKYDDHTYFKILAGHGLKGVDFIGIHRRERLYLIEIKNYKHRSYSPVGPDKSNLEGERPYLAVHIYHKIADSLRLIRIVNKYLSSRWWFPFASFIRRLLKITSIKKDWHFWVIVGELSQKASAVYPVLWLEICPDKDANSILNQTQILASIKETYNLENKLETEAFQITSLDKHVSDRILPDVKVIEVVEGKKNR